MSEKENDKYKGQVKGADGEVHEETVRAWALGDDERVVGQIHKKMAAILAAVGPITKDDQNPQQHYFFRGVDAVANRLTALFAKHGIYVLPEVLDCQRETNDRYDAKGQIKGKMFSTVARIQFTFTAPDGSSVSAVTLGEGSDFSDKASNKAMSAAFKYCMLQTFCIATQGDADSESPETGAPSEEAQVEDQISKLKYSMARKLKETGSAVETEDFYKAVCGELLKKDTVETLDEGRTVIESLKAGEFDWTTGDRIPSTI